MIRFNEDNGILDFYEQNPDSIAVVPVNTLGVMGAGLALGFKEKYPELLPVYQDALNTKKLQINRPCFVRIKKLNRRFILFPTKVDWKKPSNLLWIESGLEGMDELLNKCGAPFETVVLVPKLGCGLGGLNWETVLKTMEKYFISSGYDYLIFPKDKKNDR